MSNRFTGRGLIRAGALLGALLAALVSSLALAQQPYPSRPISVIVPFPPGGVVDNAARAIAQSLSPSWGQSIVVENRGGASGAIAMEVTAHAAPDGYTLVIMSVTAVIYPEMNKTPYDVVRDFAPVTRLLTRQAEGPQRLDVTAQHRLGRHRPA